MVLEVPASCDLGGVSRFCSGLAQGIPHRSAPALEHSCGAQRFSPVGFLHGIGALHRRAITGTRSDRTRFVVALPVLALLFWLQTPSQKALPANSSSLELLAGMALVPGLAALLCYYFGLRSTIASVASVGELAFPLTAVAANWFLLDVRLAPSQLAGGAILVSCMTFLTYLDSREKDARQSPSLALS